MEESEELIRRGILPVLLQGLLRRDPGLSQMAASALVELLRTGEGKFFAALLYSIGVVSAMSEFLETSPHDDLAIPLCDVFNALSQLSALPTDSKDRFLAHRTSFLENCPNPDYFDEELFDIFLTTGIMLDKPCMSLISTFLASPNENVIAPLLAALSRLIQVNPDDYVQFLIVGRPIAHRFEEWIATGNRALVSEVAQFIFTLFSPSVEEVPIFSAGITSLETLVHILELPELDELVQKTAIYAMYNLCEGDGGLTAHFQTPEVTEWLLRLADSPSFFVRRAVVQLFVSVDMRRPASGMRTDLTRRVMDSIVDLIDGYRGEMLEALINRLGILFRRACEAGDCEVIADFERMGGVDALYTVMDDEMACGKAQERAVALFDAFFNHALISE
jgi:hypothetical protein